MAFDVLSYAMGAKSGGGGEPQKLYAHSISFRLGSGSNLPEANLVIVNTDPTAFTEETLYTWFADRLFTYKSSSSAKTYPIVGYYSVKSGSDYEHYHYIGLCVDTGNHKFWGEANVFLTSSGTTMYHVGQAIPFTFAEDKVVEL